MQYRAWLRYYESHSQDKQCITILLDNIEIRSPLHCTELINTNYNLYIVSQLLKTIVHTNNGQWLGDKVHTHITWLAVNHEKLLYLLIVLMWHTTVLRISSDVHTQTMQKIRLLYYILVNVDIVYTPEACDDLWRAIPALLTLSEHTEYMVPPPPPINIKSDLRFPREWPLRSWKFRISGKFRKNLMPGYSKVHERTIHYPCNITHDGENTWKSRSTGPQMKD